MQEMRSYVRPLSYASYAMVDPDKQMIRGQDGDNTNLAIGEPIFLQKWMRYVIPDVDVAPAMPLYPPYRGSSDLLAALKAWYPGQYAVVTNGAKQGLLAAMYALPPGAVLHSAPHWPSYPTLARLSGRQFSTEWIAKRYPPILFTSSPNNPDGHQETYGNHPKWIIDGNKWESPVVFDVWDAAYAHWVYDWNQVIPRHTVSVWSAAKAFGLSGERVGWALTKDEGLAEKMADYIEKTTSGVNVRAQDRVAKVFTHVNDDRMQEAYQSASFDLRKNIVNYRALIKPHTVESKVGVGMFAWFKAANPILFKNALRHAKVTLVDGKACGMDEDGWYRMSLGQTPEVQEEALSRLAKELDHG